MGKICMIPFNQAPYLKKENRYIKQVLRTQKTAGDGFFCQQCTAILSNMLHIPYTFLTTSGTHALELAALLCDICPGDEIIMPSYTFPSTASAFALRGAIIVFVDIRPDTMNMDESLIEDAITERTKAIVPVHYAGVGCEMDRICEIAAKHHLYVIEDASQALNATYKKHSLGTLGTIGCFSFHETKNYSMGEGGAIALSDRDLKEQAEIFREKGTQRSKYLRGEIDKYTWVDLGSSYVPSELNAAYLCAQLEQAEKINRKRLLLWTDYEKGLRPLCADGRIDLAQIPNHCGHNAHMFYIKTKNIEERRGLMQHLKSRGIESAWHYIPLHTSKAGQKFGRFHGEDRYTTQESNRLLRLPLHYHLKKKQVRHVINAIYAYYGK